MVKVSVHAAAVVTLNHDPVQSRCEAARFVEPEVYGGLGTLDSCHCHDYCNSHACNCDQSSLIVSLYKPISAELHLFFLLCLSRLSFCLKSKTMQTRVKNYLSGFSLGFVIYSFGKDKISTPAMGILPFKKYWQVWKSVSSKSPSVYYQCVPEIPGGRSMRRFAEILRY